jgi:hypothetical protein
MLRRVLIGLLACAAVTGCAGGATTSEDVLGETAAKLGEIRSGTLDLSLIITPRQAEDEPFGFELRGPFDLGRSGSLPLLEIEYTQIANGQRGTVTLISTGDRVWVRTSGETVPLAPAEAAPLRSAAEAVAGEIGLEQLAIDDWIVDPRLSDGGEMGGVRTERVQGTLDIAATVTGLLELARGLGRSLPQLDRSGREHLRKATRSTRFDLYTGADDRLLRRLTMEADFALDVPEDFRESLGELVGAKVAFQLGVDRPNEPVEVEAPR